MYKEEFYLFFPLSSKDGYIRTRSLPAMDAKLKYLRCFRLSDLEIGDVIGRGFYGNVTKITHRHTGQEMVMKEMLNCTEESKKVFRKEVSRIQCTGV